MSVQTPKKSNVCPHVMKALAYGASDGIVRNGLPSVEMTKELAAATNGRWLYTARHGADVERTLHYPAAALKKTKATDVNAAIDDNGSLVVTRKDGTTGVVQQEQTLAQFPTIAPILERAQNIRASANSVTLSLEALEDLVRAMKSLKKANGRTPNNVPFDVCATIHVAKPKDPVIADIVFSGDDEFGDPHFSAYIMPVVTN